MFGVKVDPGSFKLKPFSSITLRSKNKPKNYFKLSFSGLEDIIKDYLPKESDSSSKKKNDIKKIEAAFMTGIKKGNVKFEIGGQFKPFGEKPEGVITTLTTFQF